MTRILVADKIADAGIELLRSAAGVSFEVRHGLAPQELADTIGDFDGILIRSAVKITAEVLRSPGRLSAIARAGVGVDNVDLEAATQAGVLVLNTPDANTISTAEHTMAMMLALHRRIPQAHAHVTQGGWKRGDYAGEQLAGRTLGIIGFGRIGRAVAERALGFSMKVLAHDPFVAGDSALDGRVTVVKDLEQLLQQADCVTLHASLSPETRQMIGRDQLALMKPDAKLINCARGALIDEHALADALNAGKLGGAAIDVFATEPPTNSPLLSAKNLVLTPHLAASTTEAQQRVSVDAVEALLAYLLHGEIRSAVNVAGIPPKLDAKGHAYFDLCARMGAILSPWCAEGVDSVSVVTHGDSLTSLAAALSRQAISAVLGPHLDARINLVNAETHAESRGIRLEHAARSPMSDLTESIALRVGHQDQTHEVSGTVRAGGEPRILSIDGYRMDLVPERTLVLIFNDDQPGVIGLVGQKFGEAGINIADLALSRRGQTALMVLKLDEPLADELRDSLRLANPPILSVHTASMPPFERSDGER